MMNHNEVISHDRDTLGGTPVFTGTRVPVDSLIAHLKAGDSLDDFLVGFPTVSREQAEAFLELALKAAVVKGGDTHAAPHRLIVVVPYDPHWLLEFEGAAGEISETMGENLLALYHIGSTSIPGIYAKPVIDMLPVVEDLSMLDRQTEKLERLGYEAMGEFGIDGRRYFRRDDSAGRRTHQIHAFEHGSPHVNRHLAFRDFLRAHPVIADQYGALKRKLAEAHPHDIQAYMAGKDGFIKRVEAEALEWVSKGEEHLE